MFGANASPYARAGEWQVNVSARSPVSDDHYNGTVEQLQRQQNENYSPQWGRGLGDISLTSRAWIFNPGTYPDWNVAAGGGLKLPTGNSGYQDTFVDVRGYLPGILGNPVPGFVRREEKQYVDQSVQPGDGGWGIPPATDFGV